MTFEPIQMRRHCTLTKAVLGSFNHVDYKARDEIGVNELQPIEKIMLTLDLKQKSSEIFEFQVAMH